MQSLQKEKKLVLLKALETLGNRKRPFELTSDNIYLYEQQKRIITILKEVIYEII